MKLRTMVLNLLKALVERIETGALVTGSDVIFDGGSDCEEREIQVQAELASGGSEIEIQIEENRYIRLNIKQLRRAIRSAKRDA